MATTGDIKGILTKYQAERGDEIALNKFLNKAQKEKKIRPKGISREIFALMTEHEINKINDEVNAEKEDGSDDGGDDKGHSSRKEYQKILKQIENKDKVDKWVQYHFVNPSRTDKPMLAHWTKDKEKLEPYPFAKFNKSIEVLEFTEKEYKEAIAVMPRDLGKPIWSKGDTSMLFDLCKAYQLQFIPITDRFNFEKCEEAKRAEEKFAKKFNYQVKNPRQRKCKEKEEVKKPLPAKKVGYIDRTVEEIKDRYFQVSKVLLEARGKHDHWIVQNPFDYTNEKKRKENLEKLFMRTKEDNELEKTLIAELKKMDQLIKKTEKEEKQLEKLVNNERTRQNAMSNQQQALQMKMEEQ